MWSDSWLSRGCGAPMTRRIGLAMGAAFVAVAYVVDLDLCGLVRP